MNFSVSTPQRPVENKMAKAAEKPEGLASVYCSLKPNAHLDPTAPSPNGPVQGPNTPICASHDININNKII